MKVKKLNKIRICVSCKKEYPKIRYTGIGPMLIHKCVSCGKDAGFEFIKK